MQRKTSTRSSSSCRPRSVRCYAAERMTNLCGGRESQHHLVADQDRPANHSYDSSADRREQRGRLRRTDREDVEHPRCVRRACLEGYFSTHGVPAGSGRALRLPVPSDAGGADPSRTTATRWGSSSSSIAVRARRFPRLPKRASRAWGRPLAIAFCPPPPRPGPTQIQVRRPGSGFQADRARARSRDQSGPGAGRFNRTTAHRGIQAQACRHRQCGLALFRACPTSLIGRIGSSRWTCSAI